MSIVFSNTIVVTAVSVFLLFFHSVSAGNHIVIAPRHCHGDVRHLHLAVGDQPSRSMTVSFASTWAFPDRVAPIAGVLLAPSNDNDNTTRKEYYSQFLNTSRFVPETEKPITYELYMENHKGNESALYYAPYQHHITIEGLEPDTTYYYLPVLGNREYGIEGLEKRTRLSSLIQSTSTATTPMQVIQQHQQQNGRVENIKAEKKPTNTLQQQLVNNEGTDTSDDGERGSNNNNKNKNKRQLVQQNNAFHTLKDDHYYDDTYLERDYDQNTEVVEVLPGALLWDRNGRRLSPPPYDPTGRACIDPERIRSFRTAPKEVEVEEEGTQTETALYPMVFGIIGDIGQFEHSQQTLNHMRDHPKGMRAVILVGDIAYPDFDGRKWDTFFDFLDDHSNFDEIPLMIAAGNHDIDKQYSRKEIFLGYEHRFRMPRLHPPELGLYEGEDEKLNMDAPPYPLPYEWGNSYYAYTYGPTRHIVVNAYADMSPGSTQYEWITDELVSIDRTRTPWVLLIMHPPIYNTFALHHHDPQIFAAREHLEPLMIQYHVNVVLTGHIHAYQRTDYVAYNSTTPTGPMHITIGAGGRKCDAPFKNKEPEKWLMKRDASMYGYGRLVIENRTHAEWRWIPIAPSELHDYNQVKGDEELHLPSLDHDRITIENQYYVHLRLENE